MSLSIGTFNLNNLFSRYNFRAELDTIPPDEAGGLQLSFAPDATRVRTFMGRLVKAKAADATTEIADRIREMDVDILAVQEVEHIEILKQFNRDQLGKLYPHVVLIEGNDNRLIDVGLMSKRPLGAITSYQTARHSDDPTRRVFGRDLLQVEVLKDNGDKLLTIYNNHLKSHFVPFTDDPVQGVIDANARRRRQAETISRLVSKQERVGSKFVILGDMNDPPESPDLAPMLTIDGHMLVNGLDAAIETRPAKPETQGQGPGPATNTWTHRFNPPGPEFPRYEQLDQIWLSERLAPNLVSAHIARRSKHGGDGSDHDPAWIVLDI